MSASSWHKTRQAGWQGRQAGSVNMPTLTTNISVALTSRTKFKTRQVVLTINQFSLMRSLWLSAISSNLFLIKIFLKCFNHRHLSYIDRLVVHTCCLVRLIGTVNCCSKKKPWKTAASSRHITNLKQSIFLFWYLWFQLTIHAYFHSIKS